MDKDSNRKTLNLEATDSQPSLDANSMFPKLNLSDPRPVKTEPLQIPSAGGTNACSSPLTIGSPSSPGSLGLPVPSPIITKRTRTRSTYDKALENPIEHGVIKYFSRSKGHGFVESERGGEGIFLHISDIEGEYVPREGDLVSYRLCSIPPKLDKFQAVHVRILNFTPEVHLKWDSPLDDEEKKDESPVYLVT